MTDYSFPKSHRLLSKEQFYRVFDAKCSAADGRVIVYAAINDLDHPRIGLVVSKKVGNAVVRNQWKRLLREAFRLIQHELPTSHDFIAIPRKDVQPELDELQRSLLQVARRAAGKVKRSRRREDGV